MLDTLQYFRSTGAVSYTQVNATLDEDAFEDNSQPLTDDIKPSAEELFKCQEETVRIRLRKLTEKTGVAPDCLYHCPEQSCGGFFSVYDSWFRHMRAKHHCLECKCPHCSTPVTLPLEECKSHLERHRRHTYICFHCSSTFRSDEEASAHASAIHGSLGSWRTEQIRFNLSYSYFILIQAGLLTSRTELMPVLLNVLDERLKELACTESKALKRSWLVQRHCSSWLEEYPIDGYRTLRKKCFNGNCDFRATKWEMLFKHVREQHSIKGSAFNCCQCDFNLQNCQHWDDILNHIQQHSDSSFFICGACYSHHNYRSKISAHIREHHAARDVPIVNLIKTKSNHVYLRLAVAFANECPSFSTMRNCFCCDERGMKGDAFTAHLKRYHKFVLNYFCEWCNYPLESLQSAKEHYQTAHTVNKLKLRCELSSKYDISIQSIRDFQVHIDTSKADGGDHQTRPQVVKLECDDNVADSEDDSIVLLDEDDIVIENYIKDQEKIAEISDRPKLKCIPMTDLINPPPTTSSAIALSNQNVSSTVRPLPRIKILAARPPHNASTGPNVLISRSNPTALVSSNSVNSVYSSSIGGLAKTVLDVPNTVFASAQTPQYNTVSFDAAQFGGRG